MSDYNRCRVCQDPLKNVHHERTTPKMCASCRGDQVGGNSHIRQMFLDMKQNPTQPSEDEKWFEDDPRAKKFNANEVGSVNRSATHVSTETTLSELF